MSNELPTPPKPSAPATVSRHGRRPVMTVADDHLPVHPVGTALAIISGMATAGMTAFGAAGPGRGIAVAAAVLVVPGLATMPAVAVRWGRVARFAWTVVASIVILVLVALAMVWSGRWYPVQVTAVVLVLGSWAAAVRGLRPAETSPAHPERAPVGRRLLAAAVDALPVLVVAAAAAGSGALSSGGRRSDLILAGASLVAAACTGVYAVTGARGGTVGMRLLGLRVVDARTGAPLGVRRFAERAGTTVGLAVSLVAVILAVRSRPGTASWADQVSGSVVTTRAAVADASPWPVRPPQRWRAAHVVPAVTFLAAAATWVFATSVADVRSLGDWGLTPSLGIAWYAALAVTAVLLGVGLLVSVPEGWIAAHLGLLVLMLYGTPGLVSPTPRLPWAFKHIAVARYIEANGSVNVHGDIYQRWPGMFAWSALLGEVSGYTNPTHWEYLAEIGFALLDVVLVFALARALAPGSRWAWAAATLFAASNWVGQNYFAPQGLAYPVFLFVALMAVLHLSTEPGRVALRIESRLRRSAGPDPVPSSWPAASATRHAPTSVVAMVILAFFVIVATHQLTPYVALLALFPLFVLRYLRPFWIAIATTVLTLGYLAPNLAFINKTYGLLSSLDFVNNATYSAVNIAALSPAATWQRRGSLALAGLILVLAVLGLVRRLLAREPRQVLVVGWLMFAPALAMLGQAYGGEIRLRAYLFALPWACVAASWLFGPVGRKRRPAWSVVAYPVAVVVMSGVFAVTYFQPASVDQTSVGAVSALEWIDQHSEPGDVVLTSGVSPASIGPRYDVPTYTSLSVAKQWVRTDLTVQDVVGLARAANPHVRRIIFVVTGTSLTGAAVAPFAPGEIEALYRAMLATPGGSLAYSAGDAHVVVLVLGP